MNLGSRKEEAVAKHAKEGAPPPPARGDVDTVVYLPGKYGTVELYRYKDEGGFYDAEVTVSAA